MVSNKAQTVIYRDISVRWNVLPKSHLVEIDMKFFFFFFGLKIDKLRYDSEQMPRLNDANKEIKLNRLWKASKDAGYDVTLNLSLLSKLGASSWCNG